MTISYTLTANPKWYLTDLTGIPAGGGYLAFFSSLNKSEQKLVYQDPAGAVPWPTTAIPTVGSQAVLFDLNGTQGPLYIKIDSSKPTDLYYLEAYNSSGELLWTLDNFDGQGGGGGGDVVEAFNINNLVTNSVMWRNIGVSVTPLPTFLTIAPGAHDGLVNTPSNAAPDICFIKNNTNAIDQITFVPFTLGSAPFTGDVTPVDYLHYVCTNSPTGEVQKCIQYPITAKVQNLSNQEITVTIWARCTSGANTLTLFANQFFGDGPSASSSVLTTLGTLTLTSSWQKFNITTTIPNVSGNTLGECGNDGLFLQVGYPLNSATSIDFQKSSVYLGSITPAQEYVNYDAIDGAINTPRCGDIRTTCNNFMPGWVFMNDGSIGSSSSVASNRANTDTFNLYNQIWNSINNAWAPVLGGRGANAIADFVANKPMSLIRALGRVFAGTLNIEISQVFTADFTTGILTLSTTAGFYTGVPVIVKNTGGALPTGLLADTTYYVINIDGTTLKLATSAANAILGTAVSFSTNGTGTQTITVAPYELGQFLGTAIETISIAQMPSHNHPGTISGGSLGSSSNGPFYSNVANPFGSFSPPIPSQGGGQPHNNIQPTTYMNVFIKL